MSDLREEFRIYGSSLAIMAAVAVPAIAIFVALAPKSGFVESGSRSAGGPLRIELPPATPLTNEEAARLPGGLPGALAGSFVLPIDPEAAAQADGHTPGELLAASPAESPPADLGRAAAEASAEGRRGDLTSAEFLAADYYARGNGSGSAVQIRKTLRINGADVGTAMIRVGADSALSIARSELRGLLAQAGRADLAGQFGGARQGGFVSFQEMRSRGFAVRYDPPSDRVMLAI